MLARVHLDRTVQGKLDFMTDLISTRGDIARHRSDSYIHETAKQITFMEQQKNGEATPVVVSILGERVV